MRYQRIPITARIGDFLMKLRVALIALACALAVGLAGSIFVPSSSIAKCTDPPGGTDCK